MTPSKGAQRSIFADRGSVAAGRDVNIEHLEQRVCTVRVCAACEQRLIDDPDRRFCRACANAARLESLRVDGTLALGAYLLCFFATLKFANWVGYANPFSLALVLAVLMLATGYYGWLRLTFWAQYDAERQLRSAWRWWRTRKR